MSGTLPTAIARYIAGKNAGNFDDALASFAAEACVADEGQDRHGPDQIRAWMEDTHRRYNDVTEVLTCDVAGPDVRITARVSGTFPGSPVTLRYAFTMQAERILRLEIA